MKKIYIVFFLIFTLLISSCNKVVSNTPISREEIIFGTIVSIKIYDSKDASILDEAFLRLKEIEDSLSINKDGTLVDKINSSSGIEKVQVTDEIIQMVKKSIFYSHISQGKFDITIGPLVNLWQIGTDGSSVPSKDKIDDAKGKVNYKDIEINEEEKTVFLKNKGMVLDFGGIAKGYAADEMTRILSKHKVSKAVIDLGGNIFVMGSKLDGSPFKVGIQDPDLNRGNVAGYILAEDKSIVTSGIYERYFVENGHTYHHILNPFTGYPEDNDILGITVVSDSSMDGDALSTMLFLMGKDQGLSYAETRSDIDVVYIMKDHKIYTSSNLNGKIVVSNDKYTLSK